MRVGVSLLTRYRDADSREAVRCVVERTRAARDAGVDQLLVGDRHATGEGIYLQNMPLLGRLLAEWGTRPAGVLIVLPLWPPVLVAEQVGTLAAIAAGGPFVVVSGIGHGAEQFGAFGLDVHDRVPLFESAFDAFRRLLDGEEVDVDNGAHQIRRARIAPTPPDGVSHWIGAGAPKAVDRAARIGDGWMAIVDLTPDEAHDRAAHYLERCAAYGRDPGVVAVRRNVHIGATDREAEEVASAFVQQRYAKPEAYVWGGVNRVVDELATYAEMGYTDVIVRELVDDHTENMKSFERLAAVREALRDV